MTALNLIDVQTEAYTTCVAAVAPLGAPPVFDHTPQNPPNEFLRIDGFNMDDRSPKNCMRGRHSFMVHFFDRPVDDPLVGVGQKRSKEVIQSICAAFRGKRIAGALVRLEYVSVERDEDGVTQAASARFSVMI